MPCADLSVSCRCRAHAQGRTASVLLRGGNKLVLEEAVPLQPAGWMLLTKRVALFFLALAVANEAIWRTMSTEAWVSFKTFGLPGAIFLFFMTQGGLFKKYGVEEKPEA